MDSIRAIDTKRPTIDQTFMGIAYALAMRSTCPRRAVGAVLTDWQGRCLSMGYNGAPRRAAHCADVGCMIIDGHCVRTVHAELNAIINLEQRVTDGILYTTSFPCPRCVSAIAQANILRVVWDQPYGDDDYVAWAHQYLKDLGIQAFRWKDLG